MIQCMFRRNISPIGLYRLFYVIDHIHQEQHGFLSSGADFVSQPVSGLWSELTQLTSRP